MTPFAMEFELLENAYPVHTRRDATATRSPRRESPRFASRRRKTNNIGGMHRRSNKRNGL